MDNLGFYIFLSKYVSLTYTIKLDNFLPLFIANLDDILQKCFEGLPMMTFMIDPIETAIHFIESLISFESK